MFDVARLFSQPETRCDSLHGNGRKRTEADGGQVLSVNCTSGLETGWDSLSRHRPTALHSSLVATRSRQAHLEVKDCRRVLLSICGDDVSSRTTVSSARRLARTQVDRRDDRVVLKFDRRNAAFRVFTRAHEKDATNAGRVSQCEFSSGGDPVGASPFTALWTTSSGFESPPPSQLSIRACEFLIPNSSTRSVP